MKFAAGPVLSLIAASASAQPAPPPAQPIASKWQLDYSPASCRLLATFGTDRDTLEIAQSSPRSPLGLTVVSKAWPNTNLVRNVGVMVEGINSFLPLNSVPLRPVGDVRYLSMPIAGGLREAMDQRVAAKQPVTLLVTTGGRSRGYSIGTAGPLLAALDQCMDNLVASWGFARPNSAARLHPCQ